jgi:hypothetical protein
LRPARPVCVVTSLTAHCQPIWFDWAWLWVCVVVGLGSYRYCGYDRLGSTASCPCCSASFVCSLEFGACSIGMQSFKNGTQSSVFQRRNSISVLLLHDEFQSNHFSTYHRCNTFIHLHRPPFEATIPGDSLSFFFGGGSVFHTRNREMGHAKFVFCTQGVRNCVLKCWTL